MFNYYASKTHDTLNGFGFYPELITQRIMLNPIYRAYTILNPLTTEVIEDSGGFQDVGKTRLTPKQALIRQWTHRNRIRDVLQLPYWDFTAVSIYDQMAGVDEAIINGRKVKIRGTEESAQYAIEETLRSANFYAKNRHIFNSSLIFIGQGINPDQYVNACVIPMFDLFNNRDWLGLGGFCIIGRISSLKSVFYETLVRLIPLAKAKNIKRIHIFGVCVTDVIREVTRLARIHQIHISSDGCTPEINGASFGKAFNSEKGIWFDTLSDKWIDYHPHALANQNIRDYQAWCNHLTIKE